MTTYLFVYGTLKRGFAANPMLSGQQFIQEAWTQPLYRLYRCGRYPGLVEDAAGGNAIRGEVWQVDEATLARLDAYEDVPHTFRRAPVQLADFGPAVAAYFYQGSLAGLRDAGNEWCGGDREAANS
jgi:gamma-glutamylcyclotransferase (GGCT)/AIG2-like uncharacterized protein YtfP